jgi:M6 family metalloprotease-like protein
MALLAATPAFADRPAEQIRAYNAQVLQLQSQARRGGAAALQAEAAASRVLAQRATALQSLMESDASAADRLAYPASVLESLAASFPQARASIEQRGRWSGELEYLIEDSLDLQKHRSIFRLSRGKEILDVRFAGAEPPGLRSGMRLDVGGVRLGNLLVAAEAEMFDAALDGDAAAAGQTAPYPAVCTASGPQPVLSILVKLPSYSLPSAVTTDFTRGALLGNAYAGAAVNTPDWSVGDFWAQASDGKAFIDATNTTVVGPVQLTSNFNTDSTGAAYCDYYGLRDAAMQAVDGQVDFRRYSRIQIVLPPNGACSWAGVANVGCRSLSSAGDGAFTAGVAWQRADTMTTRAKAVQLGTHELGHTLGMSHAASRDFGAEPLGQLTSSGTLTEYGDTHSTMGSWNLGFYAASHAANSLTWLTDGATYRTVETAGTYSIANYEARGGAVRALKVRRGTGNNAWLWIESRQNTGNYSSRLDPSLFNGALIHYQDTSTGTKSHLLDYTAATSAFSDAALPAGQTWSDPYSDVSVTVNSVTSGALTVTVNYGGVATCVQANPALSVSPTAVATEYGASTAFNVSVTNNSSSGCAGETISLGAAAPAGWSAAFGSSAMFLAPGQTGQTTLTVGVPAPYALGTYTVTTTSQSGGRSASSQENVTVTEPVNRLSLNLGNGGSVAISTPAKVCSSSCTTDYPASTSPTVTLTAQPAAKYSFSGWSGACAGTALTCTVGMNADKTVTANFKRNNGKPR